MQYIVMTLAAGSLGAFIGTKLKMPAGPMIGSMIAVLVFNLISGQAFMTAELRKITQIAAGALIGSRISREDIYGLKKVYLPAMLMVFGMIFLNFSFGFLINRVSSLDLATALFATAPGGLSDMSLIADDLGADSPKVAILQLLRIITVISLFPIILKYVCSLSVKKEKEQNRNAEDNSQTDNPAETGNETVNKVTGSKGVNLFLTMCTAAFGGTLGILLGIPAGAMVVSMAAVVIFTLLTRRGYFPRKLRVITQTITGALIGSRMGWSDINGLKDILVPAFIMVTGMLILTLLIGYSLHKLCKLDLPTSLLASTPGGLQEMSMIAEEFGANAPTVAVLQLSRLITVISVFPSMLKFVYNYFV